METNKQVTLPVTLKGNNYLLWAKTTKTVLRSRGLWGYVEPKTEVGNKVGNEKEEAKKEQEDQYVLALLQGSLEPSILAAYSYADTAKELWDILIGVYGNISNISRIFEVKRALNELQQEERSFKDLFGEYRSLWAELEILRPQTTDPKELNERRDQDQVFGLLLTLNESFKDLIKHILRFDKLPSLAEVCGLIQREEGSRDLFRSPSEAAHFVKKNSPFGEKKMFECEHCKMKGHTKERCWTLHPHLRPRRLKENGQGSKTFAGVAHEQEDTVKRSEFEALIKSLAKLTKSGKSFLTSRGIGKQNKIIVDSGASHHMIKDQDMLKNIEPYYGNVTVANGKSVPIEGIGELEIFKKETKALYMPSFSSNLLSVHKATQDLECVAVFGADYVEFQDLKTNNVFGKGKVEDGVYLLDANKQEDSKALGMKVLADVFNNEEIRDSPLWHERLGHPSSVILKMVLPNLVQKEVVCEACVLGKHCRQAFPVSSTICDEIFGIVHSDVWTAPCNSRDQYKYFVSFIDDKSRYTWVTLLHTKYQVYEAFTNFLNYVTTQFKTSIKVLRSDNGGEYLSTQFKTLLNKFGIIHQTSCAYTPQQNGVAERKNRHLMEVARTIMIAKGVPKFHWGDAVMTSNYLINRLPTKNLSNKSPFEVLYKKKPSLNHLKIFGCKCFMFLPEGQRNKLEPRSVKCVFIGYSPTQKGYKVYNPETRRVYVSREVKFSESERFYGTKDLDDLERLPFFEDPITSDQVHDDNVPIISISNHENDEGPDGDPSEEAESGPSQERDGIEEVEQEPRPPLRRSTRERIPNRKYYNNSAMLQEESASSRMSGLSCVIRECLERTASSDLVPIGDNTLLSQGGDKTQARTITYPIEHFCSLATLPMKHQVFLGKISEENIPSSYEKACESEVWVKAMEEEMHSMESNHTWYLTELPKGKKPVGCRWVYTIKYTSSGEIERYKARLVAKGYTQVYGEDYTETFAPVAKLHSVRILISIAVNLKWDLWQMDVKNAFLQGDLEEEVYMSPPQGYHEKTNKVCRLRKAIYGLKQSPRAWYQRLSSCLLEKSFIRSEADHTLFTKQSGEGIVVVLIYVDDIIITGSDKGGINQTKETLKAVFDIKDLGELKYFLGIEMTRFEDGMFICQRKYVLDLLKETGKLGSKPAKTPLEEGYQDYGEGEPLDDIKKYQRMVGKLIYLTITRPDICFAVNRVSQHMQKPTTHHWNMVERLLRYLKNNPGKGIWMKDNGNTSIQGYCDADWAGDKADRKSTTGFCTFVGGNLVTWRSKKQKVVSLSSAEAEYRAMKEVTKELVWVKAFLGDLGILGSEQISLYCDNQAAIHIASNPVFHERTKHIEIDCHFVREKIQDGIISPMFIKSEDQVADVFTKATTSSVCEYIHGKIGLKDLHQPILRGSVEK